MTAFARVVVISDFPELCFTVGRDSLVECGGLSLKLVNSANE